MSFQCADCGEAFRESERSGIRWCVKCKGPLHPECAMVFREFEDSCEACATEENARFTLVMARGSGEGREAPEDDAQYVRALPGATLRLAVDPEESDAVLPWDASVALLPIVAVNWFADEEEEN